MFNVKIKKYLDTEQMQIFPEIIYKKEDRERERKFIKDTGEICPTNRKLILNPFENEYEIGYEIHDNESECIKRSCRRTKNKIYDIARCNMWEWFFTLTFDPQKVDSFDYDLTSEKLSKWLNNLRRQCPNMKYIVVPEQHESGRWHFHGLFANVDDLVFVDSEKRDKKGRIIYNVGNYRLGFSTATKIEDWKKACSYIAKYVTDELCAVTSCKKRYWASRNVDLPIIEELLVNYDNEELLRCKDVADYRSVVQTCNGEMMYLEMPIYMTNTRRLVTSDDSNSDNDSE